MTPARLVLFLTLTLGITPAALAQREFGFDNRKPSGQPYLSPEESLKRLRVPAGWEVKVFAAEPDVINPIAFTVDERGRLWVVECYEYPSRTPKGQKPRDRVKILEDTDGDGKADKVTLWCEGKELPTFDLASGIEVGHGGAYLGAAPYLFHLRDPGNTGRCTEHEILLRGFGSQDTHETLNTFTWGPDGMLYGLHGVFTQSRVGDVQMNAALWRYDAPGRKFEVFAEGTSNPWGLDFDAHGQAFLCACVIPHCFHMVPGGTYIRQAGNSFNPYAYGLLPEISDHRHHQESGWAHAGALVLQGDHIPPEYQGHLLMGSIHGCSVKRDILERRGSTFVAKHAPDFLVSEDKNLRPINLRWGPDGSIYLIDWHDQNPCHQAAPDSWDKTHGRVYKIQRTGTRKAPPPDLARKSSRELVELLTNNNPWWHRTALRLLAERRDKTVSAQLLGLALQSSNPAHTLRGLWGLYAVGAFDEAAAEPFLSHNNPWVRAWAVRLLGEGGKVSDKMLARLTTLAEKDPAPEVRLQLASTAQRLREKNVLPLLHQLMRHKEDAQDRFLPLMIWLAYEPRVAATSNPALRWLKENAAGNPLVTDEIVPRTLRRLVATGKPEELAACVAFLAEVKDASVRRRALEGMLLALQNRQVDPPGNWAAALATLRQDGDAEVQRLAGRLAVNFRDLEAIRRALAVARDATRLPAQRLDAVRDLGLAHPPEARAVLLDLVKKDANDAVRAEACRALAAYDTPGLAREVLAGWKVYPPGLRVEAVNLLGGRKEWAAELLTAVGKKEVPRTDLTDNTILRIRAFRDKKVNDQIETVWGRFRDTPAELNALIVRMRNALDESPASFERGRKVFENQCAKCHQFEGKGSNVGPNLDGAARDIEYLLANVLDPNRVVGQPYYTRVVARKDGRVETGLLHAEDDQAVTLKTENDALKVILKKDIDELTVQEKSVMPEGLANNMTPQDFRDLIRYVMAHPFLTDVALAGPFTDRRPALDPQNPLAAPGVTWAKPAVGVSGRVALPATGGKEGTVYVAAAVTAPEDMTTRLLLGSGSPVRVWVNGTPVYDGRPGNGPDQAAAEVALRKGINRVLIQVTYRGEKEAAYARLLDPLRKLQHPEGKRD